MTGITRPLPRDASLKRICSNTLNLNQSALRKGLHSHSTAGRERRSEELGIHLVHSGEVSHIGQKNRSLDHVGQGKAGFFQDGLCIQDGLTGLLLNAAFRESARSGIDGKLSGKENKAGAAVNGLAVRADSGRSFLRADGFQIG